MSTEVVKHVHKLKKHTYASGRAIYHCVLDCPYKVAVPLALGKKTLCWRCSKPFNLNEYSLRLVKPHCNECKRSKEELKSEVTSANTPIPSIPSSVNDLRQKLNRINLPFDSTPKVEDDLL